MKNREQLAEEHCRKQYSKTEEIDYLNDTARECFKAGFDKALKLALNTMEKINVEKHRDVAMTQDSKYAYANGCFHHMYKEVKKLGES